MTTKEALLAVLVLLGAACVSSSDQARWAADFEDPVPGGHETALTSVGIEILSTEYYVVRNSEKYPSVTHLVSVERMGCDPTDVACIWEPIEALGWATEVEIGDDRVDFHAPDGCLGVLRSIDADDNRLEREDVEWDPTVWGFGFLC